jgi:RNA polymerase sigma factor (sigma-70 family)
MQAEGEVVAFPAKEQSPPDFRAFFEDEHRGLLKALHFVTGDRAEAADLMQDSFLKLWERWDRIDTIQDPRAYLFRVAFNGWKMRARSATRAAKHAVPLVVVRDPYDDVDIREDVRRMLLTLTPRQRAALVLLDLYGYGSEDAARIMGIRPSTVRALATQGRAVLRAAGGPTDG